MTFSQSGVTNLSHSQHQEGGADHKTDQAGDEPDAGVAQLRVAVVGVHPILSPRALRTLVN